MFLTWGVQLFFWTQKYFFKSDGGAMHKFFVKAVNLGAINFFLFYWVIDIMIIRGTIEASDSSTGDWLNFGLLFLMQIVFTVIG